MKGFILYRSYYGNTRQVAEAIAAGLTSAGHETAAQGLDQKLPDAAGADFVMVGSPTRFKGVNGKALRVIRKLAKKGFADKPFAVFDTFGPVPADPAELEKGRAWLYPGAEGRLRKTAENAGLHVFEETLRCEVTGMNGPLKDETLTDAAAFAKKFAASLK
ncbi:MAG: hypothetical protein E4H36_10770 [Spirochaetales bacterium]|nr:MAG: hypothetical protein E4H36_10770 [Spirochaetales bacterium]